MKRNFSFSFDRIEVSDLDRQLEWKRKPDGRLGSEWDVINSRCKWHLQDVFL